MSGQDLACRYRITKGADKPVTDHTDPISMPMPRRSVPLLGWFVALQQGQRGALMPWSAVMLGLGVAGYFALPVEPGLAGYGAALVLLGAGIALAVWRRDALGPLGVALALLALGGLAAGWRAHQVAGPVLDFRYYGAIEGRVVGVDRSASDALRLTLDRVRLEDMDPARTPLRVRVSLHGDGRGPPPVPGSIVMLTGHLSAPGGPAEPGGFDFQHHAHFQGLGGVGYARTPLMLLEARTPGAARLFHLRMALSTAIQARIAGQPGAFAAAVLTGDRSGLDAPTVEAMRASNIAHLLAISGLHMGLLTGFVYAALRQILALIPALALRYPIRKWAAGAALGVGAFYLAMSGGNVATERAFIQVAVMFAAVLLDRRAITLRSVAIAAIIVLLHRPETLLSPGFQMSFAATAALVGVFGALRGAVWMRGWPGWARGIFALVVSSKVAGAATAPFSAVHFNQIAVYGLVANLLTVPVMGSVIIPGAVLAACLWPLGLSGPVWLGMEWGLRWILAVSARVAAWPGAVDAVPTPAGWTLGVITLGALWVLLWQGARAGPVSCPVWWRWRSGRARAAAAARVRQRALGGGDAGWPARAQPRPGRGVCRRDLARKRWRCGDAGRRCRATSVATVRPGGARRCCRAFDLARGGARWPGRRRQRLPRSRPDHPVRACARRSLGTRRRRSARPAWGRGAGRLDDALGPLPCHRWPASGGNRRPGRP